MTLSSNLNLVLYDLHVTESHNLSKHVDFLCYSDVFCNCCIKPHPQLKVWHPWPCNWRPSYLCFQLVGFRWNWHGAVLQNSKASGVCKQSNKSVQNRSTQFDFLRNRWFVKVKNLQMPWQNNIETTSSNAHFIPSGTWHSSLPIWFRACAHCTLVMVEQTSTRNVADAIVMWCHAHRMISDFNHNGPVHPQNSTRTNFKIDTTYSDLQDTANMVKWCEFYDWTD